MQAECLKHPGIRDRGFLYPQKSAQVIELIKFIGSGQT
jgi:hypothetical protein